MNALAFNLKSIHAKHAAEVSNNNKKNNMKLIKLNKFDKSRDLTWDSLSGFSIPANRNSVIMMENERAAFRELIYQLDNNKEVRAVLHTSSDIFIVEIE